MEYLTRKGFWSLNEKVLLKRLSILLDGRLALLSVKWSYWSWQLGRSFLIPKTKELYLKLVNLQGWEEVAGYKSWKRRWSIEKWELVGLTGCGHPNLMTIRSFFCGRFLLGKGSWELQVNVWELQAWGLWGWGKHDPNSYKLCEWRLRNWGSQNSIGM